MIVSTLFLVADVSFQVVSMVVAELPGLTGESAAADSSSGHIIAGMVLIFKLDLNLNHDGL